MAVRKNTKEGEYRGGRSVHSTPANKMSAGVWSIGLLYEKG